MSRTGSQNGLNPLDIICPVCKSSAYLNRSLEFLINPECYHKMCSTCVDRIFSSGPASCPVPHCGKTLRKKGFHKSFFDDLKIEREVDIRRRVGKVFNKRQDEFESLLDWNNYLEDVEDIVFSLQGSDRVERMKAEKKLIAYAEGNRGEIEENARAAEEAAEIGKLREKAEKEAARERRLLAIKEELDEKADVDKTRREMLNRLAYSDEDPNAVAQQTQKIILKKASARRNLAESKDTSSGVEGLTIRGLKKKVVPVAEKPYDPFGGLDMKPSRYVLQADYPNDYLNIAKRDPNHTAGGYSFQEYSSRAMFEAVSGLAVFIEDEVADRAVLSPAAPTTAPAPKIKLKIKQESDDVF
jgi:CDK-activating kinase assembly factor MAT1